MVLYRERGRDTVRINGILTKLFSSKRLLNWLLKCRELVDLLLLLLLMFPWFLGFIFSG